MTEADTLADMANTKPRKRRTGGPKRSSPAPDLAWRRWLQSPGRTVARVAEDLGVSPATVYQWADGRLVPTLERAIAIHEYSEGVVDVRSWPDLADLVERLLGALLGRHLDDCPKCGDCDEIEQLLAGGDR